MSALVNTPTLAKLAAHQQAHKTYAFSFDEEDRRLARLRAVYAKKIAELNAFGDLYEETTPNFILRAANGRELVLWLPTDDARSLCCTLREVLETEIRFYATGAASRRSKCKRPPGGVAFVVISIPVSLVDGCPAAY